MCSEGELNTYINANADCRVEQHLKCHCRSHTKQYTTLKHFMFLIIARVKSLIQKIWQKLLLQTYTAVTNLQCYCMGHAWPEKNISSAFHRAYSSYRMGPVPQLQFPLVLVTNNHFCRCKHSLSQYYKKWLLQIPLIFLLNGSECGTEWKMNKVK